MSELRVLDDPGYYLGGDNGEAVREVIMSDRFQQYGDHPDCYGCRYKRECKTYAAPDSVIIYCRRWDRRSNV